jgi:ABC-type transport system involved in multi-copper enzyme maturation permease subunit
MSLEKTGTSWLRHNLAWSNSWPSWQERLILLLFLAGAGALAWLTFSVVQAQGPQIGALSVLGLLWGAYFIAVVIGSWLGWLKLFGPVLFYDMVRTARRSRYVFIRLLYASLLLVILCVMFFTTSETMNRNGPQQREAAVMAAAMLAQTFFMVFMLVQLALVVLLTPAYVAGAIAEEKDRKTLEFMLATDLNNREIVLSKLLSRMANMTLFLLTGLPILSILQFMGGVDSELMLAGFAGTGLTMLGLASVSILCSTLFQKPRDAIGMTYLLMITYVALGALFKSMATPLGKEPIWNIPFSPTWDGLSEVVNAGNPLAAIFDIQFAMRQGTLATKIPELLTNFVWFHVVLTLICISWSIMRLRAIALKTPSGAKMPKILGWWQRYRPPIGELPMMWKEIHIEGRMRRNWIVVATITVLVFLSLGTGLLAVGFTLWDAWFGWHRQNWHDFSRDMNIWFRIAGTSVACLMILIVAVRASTCIAHERERDTFDALLTTPLSAEAMLWGKLIGCLTSLRMGWLWFGSMVLLALFSGGLHLLAVPIVIGSWFIYATFFTLLGMWFSMTCKTTMRATVYTVLTTLFLGGGHWVLMGFLCYMPVLMLSHGGGPGDFLEYLAKFELGMTPPAVLVFYSYSWENLAHDFQRGDDFEKHVMLFAVFGLVLWCVGCLVMWYGLLLPRFRQITRREELIYE